MLSPANRLTKPDEFRSTVRHGRRVGGPLFVLHAADPVETVRTGTESVDAAPRVGFVVSKQVGPAVIRNQVKRRLRHVVRQRLGMLKPGGMVVVRALPAAAGAPSTALSAEFERCLSRVTR